MIKQICPHCLKAVSIPDDAMGKEVTCPECAKVFSAPARYDPTVAVDAPAAPTHAPVTVTPTVPPAPPGYIPPAPHGSSPPVPTGYTHSRGITISPPVVAWLPVIFLTLTLLLTLFTWVGSYIGGHPMYAQGPWRAAIGRVWRNHPLEELLVSPGAAAVAGPASAASLWDPRWVDRVKSDWELMVPFLAALALATALAWEERLVAKVDRARLPKALRWVAVIWPYRIPVIAGLTVLAVALLLTQISAGFGMERALRTVTEEKYAAEREQAKNSESAQEMIDFKVEEDLGRYHLQRTTWLYLAIVCSVLAVLTIILRVVLDRRGHKPPPRLVLQY